MKKLFFLLITLQLHAQTPTATEEKKIYSQSEFEKKLNEEVQRKVDEVKNKSVAELTKELLEKEAKLQEREKTIVQKEEMYSANVKDLKRQVDEFEVSKKKIIGCVEDNKSKENNRISKLVEVISNMKPQQASELLETQDSEISVKILSELDPVKASKIFNLMGKENSARLQKQYLNMKK